MPCWVKTNLVAVTACLFTMPTWALAVTPSDGAAVQAGYDMLVRGQYPDAIRTLTPAVRAHPDAIPARRYLAHALVRSGDASAALDQFGILANSFPLEAVDEAALGDAYLSLGDLVAAAQAYKKATLMDPHLEVAWAGLAKAYEIAGQHDAAVALCKQGMTQASNLDSRNYLQGVFRGLQQQNQVKVPVSAAEAGQQNDSMSAGGAGSGGTKGILRSR